MNLFFKKLFHKVKYEDLTEIPAEDMVTVNATDIYSVITVRETPNIASGVILENIEVDLSQVTGTYTNLAGIVLYDAIRQNYSRFKETL